MACRFANIKRFEDEEYKAVFLARVSRKPGYMSWSVDCQGTHETHIWIKIAEDGLKLSYSPSKR